VIEPPSLLLHRTALSWTAGCNIQDLVLEASKTFGVHVKYHLSSGVPSKLPDSSKWIQVSHYSALEQERKEILLLLYHMSAGLPPSCAILHPFVPEWNRLFFMPSTKYPYPNLLLNERLNQHLLDLNCDFHGDFLAGLVKYFIENERRQPSAVVHKTVVENFKLSDKEYTLVLYKGIISADVFHKARKKQQLLCFDIQSILHNLAFPSDQKEMISILLQTHSATPCHAEFHNGTEPQQVPLGNAWGKWKAGQVTFIKCPMESLNFTAIPVLCDPGHSVSLQFILTALVESKLIEPVILSDPSSVLYFLLPSSTPLRIASNHTHLLVISMLGFSSILISKTAGHSKTLSIAHLPQNTCLSIPPFMDILISAFQETSILLVLSVIWLCDLSKHLSFDLNNQDDISVNASISDAIIAGSLIESLSMVSSSWWMNIRKKQSKILQSLQSVVSSSTTLNAKCVSVRKKFSLLHTNSSSVAKLKEKLNYIFDPSSLGLTTNFASEPMLFLGSFSKDPTALFKENLSKEIIHRSILKGSFPIILGHLPPPPQVVYKFHLFFIGNSWSENDFLANTLDNFPWTMEIRRIYLQKGHRDKRIPSILLNNWQNYEMPPAKHCWKWFRSLWSFRNKLQILLHNSSGSLVLHTFFDQIITPIIKFLKIPPEFKSFLIQKQSTFASHILKSCSSQHALLFLSCRTTTSIWDDVDLLPVKVLKDTVKVIYSYALPQKEKRLLYAVQIIIPGRESKQDFLFFAKSFDAWWQQICFKATEDQIVDSVLGFLCSIRCY